jgi:hypothetical protein
MLALGVNSGTQQTKMARHQLLAQFVDDARRAVIHRNARERIHGGTNKSEKDLAWSVL